MLGAGTADGGSIAVAAAGPVFGEAGSAGGGDEASDAADWLTVGARVTGVAGGGCGGATAALLVPRPPNHTTAATSATDAAAATSHRVRDRDGGGTSAIGSGAVASMPASRCTSE